MRIAINTRLLIPGKMDGIGWFTAETARRLAEAHPEVEFLFLFDRQPDPQFVYGRNVTPVVVCPPARHPVLWWMFFELGVSRALRKHRADLFLSPDGFIPLHSGVPCLPVIHDLNFEHASGNLRRSHQWYMTHFFPRFARRAARVATVSDYSRRDIAATYGLPAERIDVVYDGANPLYRPHTPAEQEATRQRFTGGARYLLFVSTILPRKNLQALLRAFDAVRDRRSGEELRLVVVGNRAWWGSELRQAYNGMRHTADVHFLGHAGPDDLAALMSAAEALVYPSFFEGFGIPILEAMQAETAVICSGTTSMPEVGGEAALYIDPARPDTLCDAICSLLDNPELRTRLVGLGRQQRTRFSWDRTADLLWQSLMKCLPTP